MLLAAFVMAAAVLSPVQMTFSSASDCAVLAAIGRSQLAWDVVAPNYPFYPVFDTGRGAPFTWRCDWPGLHLVPPKIGDPSSKTGFFLSRPKYNWLGRRAVAYLTVSGGPGMVSMSRCTLKQSGPNWKLIGCQLEAIS